MCEAVLTRFMIFTHSHTLAWNNSTYPFDLMLAPFNVKERIWKVLLYSHTFERQKIVCIYLSNNHSHITNTEKWKGGAPLVVHIGGTEQPTHIVKSGARFLPSYHLAPSLHVLTLQGRSYLLRWRRVVDDNHVVHRYFRANFCVFAITTTTTELYEGDKCCELQ